MQAATTLEYMERPPAEGDPAHAALLVLLHGWASFENHLLDLATDVDPRLRIVAPRAPVRMGPGAYRWFDFQRRPSDAPIINDTEETASFATLCRFLETLARSHPDCPIYLLGHSQGGTMALSVALRRPDLISGCADVNGRILKKAVDAVTSPSAVAEIPFFHGHGEVNSIVPIAVGRETRDTLRRLRVDLEYREYQIDHEITPEAFADATAWLRIKAREPVS